MLFNLISFLSGFLFSSVLDTTLGEFSEWAIVGAALIVSSLEIVTKIFIPQILKYTKKNSIKSTL